MRPATATVLLVPVLLVAVLVLAGCGTTAESSPAAVTTTTTATATVTTTATPPTAPADRGLATRLAALACEGYVFAGTQDAASGSASYDRAAGTGTSAAVVDPTWTDLAAALAFLAALSRRPTTPPRTSPARRPSGRSCAPAAVTPG